MRVAWDLQAVTGPKPTGLGVSVRLLLDAVRGHAPEIELVGLRPNERDAPLIGVKDRLLWEQWRLPRAVTREHARRPLSLLYSPALGAPLSCRVPVVAHVHDLIALRYAAQFHGAAGWYWKTLLPATWRRCRALTVSNASLVGEVAELLRYPRERVFVVPYYPDPQVALVAQALMREPAQPQAARQAEPYFITLASHEPRKNIELAITALGILKARGVPARLGCLGGRTPHTPALAALAQRCNVSAAVEFPGYMERGEIVRHFLNCTALLFVSRYEGYGMPPQEAQSAGCPVILSDIACHRSVYSDPARLAQLPPEIRLAPPLVGVDDAEGLAGEMQRLLEDAAWRGRLSQAGLAYCGTFSAEATARALHEAYAAALSQPA